MTRSLYRHLLVVLLTLPFLVIPTSSAQPPTDTTAVSTKLGTWPQWRGPSRDGTSLGEPWPKSLEGLELQWRKELAGPSYSGPIVADGRLFVTATENEKTEVVIALDQTTGEQLWRTAWPGAGSVPFFARANGDWIRSTPSYQDGTLYVGGINEVLVAIDAANGKIRWQVDFPSRFETPVPPFGFSSSPLVVGDHLYVQAANSLVKLDTTDGSTIWRKLEEGGDMSKEGAFSSPVLGTVAGREQLLVLSRSTLYGLDPASGTELWSTDVPSFRGMNILTPIALGDAIFTSGHQNGSRLYRLTESDKGLDVEEAWLGKASGYMSSPVIIDDHVYLHLGNGRLTSLELATGASKWTSKPFGKYWSMTTRDDKILALDERGDLVLVRANPEQLDVLDKRQITDSEAWAYLAVPGDQVIIRDLDSVTVYSWSSTASDKPGTTPAKTENAARGGGDS